ncbi:MAG: Transcriptional regulator of heat shock protein [uncultured bacterium]|nr:MAG: Transcriptional regulator of heat shock protein [uncultured bacterium]
MDARKKAILGAVVREYTDSAEPVGSRVLVDKYDFRISTATVRNEMKALEKEGYIYQPHTSAGRIPTNKGYRFFVDSLVDHVDLAKKEQEKLEKKLQNLRESYDRVLKNAAGLLAQVTGNVALTEKGEEEIFCSGIANILQQPEFADVEKACKIAEVFEKLGEEISKIEEKNPEDVAVYIGPESSITEELDCSLVVSRFKLPSGEKGHVAVLGPTRMKYGKTISIVKYLSSLLGGSVGGFIFLINFI